MLFSRPASLILASLLALMGCVPDVLRAQSGTTESAGVQSSPNAALLFTDLDALKAHRASENVQAPRIALILSGGGAKGLAHIGVLDVLDSAHIPIDLIVGTSIGASIGGYYAAGYSPKALEHFALTTNWSDVLDLGGDSHRSERLLSQKGEDNSLLSLRFTGFFDPVIPQALSSGERLTMLINSMVINAPGGVPRDFLRDMRVPFIAVATDIVKGERRILTHGDLTEALRASATLPLRFDPLSQDSAILMDGGLMSNIPADIAKSLGAATIVVSDATARLRPREELNTPWDVADQVISLMMQRQNKEELKLADIVVTPELAQVSSDDFHNIPEMIEAGRAAARAMLPRLRARLNGNPTITREARIEGKSVGSTTEIQADTLLAQLAAISLLSNIPDERDRQLDSLPNIARYIGHPVIADGAHSLYPADQSDQSVAGRSAPDPASLKDLENDVVHYYRARGWSLARIDSIVVHPKESRLDFYLDAGEIGQILIKGNDFVNSDVVLRELPFSSRDIFRADEADRALHNLTATGLFDFATIQIAYDSLWHGPSIIRRLDSIAGPVPTSRTYTPTILVTVHPRAASVIRLGVLADNEFGAQFSTEIANENFLGSALSLSLKGGLGPDSRYASLTANAPRLFSSIATFYAQAYAGYRDISVYSESPIPQEGRIQSTITDVVRESRDIGVLLRAGGQVGRLGALMVQVRGERQRWFSLRDTLSSNNRLELRAVRGELIVDTRDDAAYPHTGTLVDGYIESGVKLFGGGVSYTKLFASLQEAMPLSALHTVVPSFSLGFGDTYLPRLEQFDLGGITSFYGLNAYELRAKQMIDASLDYQIAIPHALFFPTYVSMRYDLGATWPEPEEIKFATLQHGIGAQVGLKTPLGLARFGIGENFRFITDKTKPVDLNKPRFYFSIGANL